MHGKRLTDGKRLKHRGTEGTEKSGGEGREAEGREAERRG
jgi:hypothetical protein